jgi:hypothetical protein
LLGRAGRFFVPLGLPAMAAFTADLGHVGAVTADRLSALTSDLRHVLAIFTHGRSALPSDFGHVSSITADRFAAFAADPRHVATILANGHSTFSTRFSGLLGRELMCPALDVGGFSPLACYLALPLCIHRGETAPRLFRHDAALLICPSLREANEVPLREALCWLSRRQVPQAAARETRERLRLFQRDESGCLRSSGFCRPRRARLGETSIQHVESGNFGFVEHSRVV